jgi:ligand-binding SRPBCC domain-containing protein|tara:strand:- start:199 stop:648 length:450 start_codon:yes stop_codon:yes gene_type:complete
MNLILKAPVKGNYKKVMKAFDRELFEALKPPYGEMEIAAFTGSKKGDKVHMKFHKPLQAEWISHITEDGETDQRAWFVDVGVQLPWPLATWTHRHIVEKVDDNNSIIVDDMTFTGKNFLLTLLLYPGLFLGFYPRKKVYQAYFEKQYNA